MAFAATRHHAVRTALAVGHAEAAEELTQAGRDVFHVLAADTIGLRTTVKFDANGNHGRFDLLDDVGKANRRGHLLRLFGQVLCERRRITLEVQAWGDDESGSADTGDRGGK